MVRSCGGVPLCVFLVLLAARVPAADQDAEPTQATLAELIAERAARAKRCCDATIAAHEAETATYEHVLGAIDLRCQADLAASTTALERFNALSRRLEDIETISQRFSILRAIGLWNKPPWTDYMSARLKLAAGIAEIELIRETLALAKQKNAGKSLTQLERRLEAKSRVANLAAFDCARAAPAAFRAGLLDAAELLIAFRLRTDIQLATAQEPGATRACWATHFNGLRKLYRYCELAWQAGLERPDDGPAARASGRRKNSKLVTETDGLFVRLERERAQCELLRAELAVGDPELRAGQLESRLQELTTRRISTAHDLLTAAREDFDAYEIQLPTLIHALEGLKEAEMAAATDADERHSALERNLARVERLQREIGELNSAGQRNGAVKESARIGAHRLTAEIEFRESRQQIDQKAAAGAE